MNHNERLVAGEAGVQGSDEWKALRLQKITAGDMPVILGKSPYCTPLLLWQRKVGFAPPQETMPHMQRGTDLEPEVRAMVNRDLGTNFQPCVIQHESSDWAMASLDGYDEATSTVLEIKCGSKASHEEAQAGKLPEKYRAQVQWQMFCADAGKCFYVSYYDGEYVLIEVAFDESFIYDVALPAAKEFYLCVKEMREPASPEDDILEIDDSEFVHVAQEWKEANKMRTFYVELEKSLKEKLVEFTDDGDCKGGGITLKRVQRNGNIEWEKLWKEVKEACPEAERFNPEEYRKQQIGYWKISSEKDDDRM